MDKIPRDEMQAQASVRSQVNLPRDVYDRRTTAIARDEEFRESAPLPYFYMGAVGAGAMRVRTGDLLLTNPLRLGLGNFLDGFGDLGGLRISLDSKAVAKIQEMIQPKDLVDLPPFLEWTNVRAVGNMITLGEGKPFLSVGQSDLIRTLAVVSYCRSKLLFVGVAVGDVNSGDSVESLSGVAYCTGGSIAVTNTTGVDLRYGHTLGIQWPKSKGGKWISGASSVATRTTALQDTIRPSLQVISEDDLKRLAMGDLSIPNPIFRVIEAASRGRNVTVVFL